MRSDGFGGTKTTRLTPLKAIRQHCRECYGFAPEAVAEIRGCLSPLCPLYPFRFGKDPGSKRTPKQVEASRRNIGKALALARNRGNIPTQQLH